jgi:rare lipoprotein A
VSIEVVGFAGKVKSAAAIARQRREHTQQRMVLSNFGVQAGAFRRYQGAKIYQKKYSALYRRYNTIIRRFDDIDGGPLYRVWLMGFRSEEEARDFKAHNYLKGAFIVRN